MSEVENPGGRRPRNQPRVESPPGVHVVRDGGFYIAEKGKVVIVLSGGRAIIRTRATGIFKAGSTGTVEAGGNFTAEGDSVVEARYGSSGRAWNKATIDKHYGAEVAAEDGAIIREVPDKEDHLPPGHVFTTCKELAEDEQQLIDLAKRSSRLAHCPNSTCPVGAAVLAENAEGERATFWGCNIENGHTYTDAECNAMDDAVKNGYRKILKVAAYCPKNPGVTPGPRLRAMLRDFGLDAVAFMMFNEQETVVRFTVRHMLHRPKAALQD